MANQIGTAYVAFTLSYIFAVDVFYLLGGFLVGLLFLKAYSKNPTNWLFPVGVLQRAFRFWPMYIFTILLYWKVMPSMGTGPLFYLLNQYADSCKDSMVWELLFVSNFKELYCTGWTWYLQVDMQLFIVSLLLLWVYVTNWKWAKLASKLLGLGIAVGTVTYVFIMSQDNGYRVVGSPTDNDKAVEYQTEIYLKPWSRAAPYMLGLFTGIFYFNLQTNKTDGGVLKKLYDRMTVRGLSTLLGLALMLFFTFAPYKLLNQTAVWSQLEHSLYLALGHLLYTFGVVLVILPFMLGHSNSIRTFLEVEAFQVVAKLSFSCYMVHFIIILRQASAIVNSQYIEPWLIFTYGCSDLVLVLAGGFIICMIVEFPFAYLFDSLFSKMFKGRGKSAPS